jgi:hypothetical protein
MIGALLGHSQASTTKRYAHLASTQHKTNSEAVGKALSEAMTTPKKPGRSKAKK